MNKQDLIQKLKKLEGLTAEEKADLINLVNTNKKYGLIWEDKLEVVEEQLRQSLPVLKEVKEKAILAEGVAPNHVLIEGDNLHALTALTFTHEGRIDLIYIDPPYNTGKPNEFKYNDRYVDEEDSFRHSKWLSFMHKRLKIAHKLLSNKGLIIINIDDHEVSQLNLLCNEIFNNSQNPKNSNQLGLLVWDLGAGTSAGHFTRTNEFILVYAKDKRTFPNFSGGVGVIDDRAQKKISNKNRASEFLFPAGTKFEAVDGFELEGRWGGTEETRLISGRMICEKGRLKEDIVLSAGWTQKKQMTSFFAGEETIDSKGQKVIEFYFRDNGKIYSRKDRSKLNPPSVLRDIATTKQGSSLLKSIFGGEEPIQFVKPVQLVQYFLELLPNNIRILDFFAGSGTTLHAAMQLNADDKGSRQCILVTNNENNICEEVTYERNKKVIQGYTNTRNEKVAGLINNSLRYYKTDFVASIKSEVDKRLLTHASTELLQIKENCYLDVTGAYGFNLNQCGIFTDNAGRYMMVVYHSRRQFDVCERLVACIKRLETRFPVKLYAFSPERETLIDDFADVADRIDAVPLPQAIYNAYRNTFRTLKLDRRVNHRTELKDTKVESDLFTTTSD